MPGAGLFTMSVLTIIYTYFPGLIGPLFNAMGADMDMNMAMEFREMAFEFLKIAGPVALKDFLIPLIIEIAKNHIPWI